MRATMLTRGLMEADVAHVTQIANGRIAGCSEVVCYEIETRLVETNAKPGNANADNDDVLSTWIMNEFANMVNRE